MTNHNQFQVESKNIDQVNIEKNLEVLKAKQKSLQAEIKEVNEQIEECINITNVLEDKYKSSVNFGKKGQRCFGLNSPHQLALADKSILRIRCKQVPHPESC
uniref:Uncharacterized protein n=1 Tax=Cacopsylla melanoneura TaxID=428564 RepID=A0A8D8Z6C4_9HEMI